ncbi:hypothetical protein [Halalkalicoccus ordinarius]
MRRAGLRLSDLRLSVPVETRGPLRLRNETVVAIERVLAGSNP